MNSCDPVNVLLGQCTWLQGISDATKKCQCPLGFVIMNFHCISPFFVMLFFCVPLLWGVRE